MEKAAFVRKIECPNPEHDDSNPSCALYSDGSAYCFVCCTYFKQVEGFQETTKKIEKEDLEKSLSYIDNLPKASIRGLSFPSDDIGYYIVWPNRDYYKIRMHDSLANNKYVGAKGHSKPLFVIPAKEPTRTCIVVEGEINALSLATTLTSCDIVSPGGVGNFTDNNIVSELHKFCYYDNIIVCTDSDAAGLHGALKFKYILYAIPELGARVHINLMEKDFNQLLVEYGQNFKEKVEKEFKNLGVSTRL